MKLGNFNNKTKHWRAKNGNKLYKFQKSGSSKKSCLTNYLKPKKYLILWYCNY